MKKTILKKEEIIKGQKLLNAAVYVSWIFFALHLMIFGNLIFATLHQLGLITTLSIYSSYEGYTIYLALGFGFVPLIIHYILCSTFMRASKCLKVNKHDYKQITNPPLKWFQGVSFNWQEESNPYILLSGIGYNYLQVVAITIFMALTFLFLPLEIVLSSTIGGCFFMMINPAFLMSYIAYRKLYGNEIKRRKIKDANIKKPRSQPQTKQGTELEQMAQIPQPIVKSKKDKLQELKECLDADLINETDYENSKSKILSE